VIITVSGGVANVMYKPRGLAISIFDYDVEGSDEGESLSKDPDGQRCTIAEWPESEIVVGNKHWPLVKNASRNLATSSSRKWKCPDCRRIISCSYETLAEAGSPYCPDCEAEMELV